MFITGFLLGAYAGSIGTGLMLLALGSMLLWAKRRDRRKSRRILSNHLLTPAE